MGVRLRKRHRAFPFLWEDAALLILDPQLWFTDPAGPGWVEEAPLVLQALEDLRRRFVAHRRPVWVTRHHHEAGEGMMGRWWRRPMAEGDPLTAPDSRLGMEGVEAVFKRRYDAFAGTVLEERIRCLGVRRLVVGGFLLGRCGVSTILSAFNRDLEVFTLPQLWGEGSEKRREELLGWLFEMAALPWCEPL